MRAATGSRPSLDAHRSLLNLVGRRDDWRLNWDRTADMSMGSLRVSVQNERFEDAVRRKTLVLDRDRMTKASFILIIEGRQYGTKRPRHRSKCAVEYVKTGDRGAHQRDERIAWSYFEPAESTPRSGRRCQSRMERPRHDQRISETSYKQRISRAT